MRRDGRSERFHVTVNEFRHPRVFEMVDTNVRRVASARILDAAEAWFDLLAKAESGSLLNHPALFGTMLRPQPGAAAGQVLPLATQTRDDQRTANALNEEAAGATIDDLMQSLGGSR